MHYNEQNHNTTIIMVYFLFDLEEKGNDGEALRKTWSSESESWQRRFAFGQCKTGKHVSIKEERDSLLD